MLEGGLKARLPYLGKTAMKATQAAINELNLPSANSELDKAFQTYASFGGDLIQTSHALSLEVPEVARMADEQRWAARLKAVFELRKAGNPHDVERAISRTINLVQAHRLRVVLDRVVNELYTKTGEELLELCTSDRKDKDGNIIGQTLNLKPYTELAAALEKVHMMTYYALTDSPTERGKRKADTNEGMSVMEIHSAIAEQMAQANGPKPAEVLSDEAKRQGEQAATVIGPYTSAPVEPNPTS